MAEATDLSAIDDLVRAVRSRVPVDAAELLAQESPEVIETVLRALPSDLARRIMLELPAGLRPTGGDETVLQAPNAVRELMEKARGVVESGTTVQQAIDYLREADS